MHLDVSISYGKNLSRPRLEAAQNDEKKTLQAAAYNRINTVYDYVSFYQGIHYCYQEAMHYCTYCSQVQCKRQ